MARRDFIKIAGAMAVAAAGGETLKDLMVNGPGNRIMKKWDLAPDHDPRLGGDLPMKF